MNARELHKKYIGKLNISSVLSIDSKEILSEVYTPGVGDICMDISQDESKLKELTIAGRTVAVISDGTAVLGFGDIGPKAALPVMEGKSAIFKEFAGIQSYPICIEEKDPEKFIEIVKSIAMNFAAINLEDIAAPKCFDIEARLTEELDIPVIHDDQHGTAIVTLAGLFGAIELTGKEEVSISLLGAGAAGIAIAKLLLAARDNGMLSISKIKMFDSKGLISSDRNDLNKYKQEMAILTEQSNFESFEVGIQGTDVFIGVAVAGALKEKYLLKMNKEPIVFALANPVPEIMPDLAVSLGASIVATGRSDFPNQINNALVYPGLFKGLLEGRINTVRVEHKLAAAKALFEYNRKSLTKENILPSILDRNIPGIIAKAVMNT